MIYPRTLCLTFSRLTCKTSLQELLDVFFSESWKLGLELQKLIFQCLASYGFVGDKIVCLHRGQSVRNGQKIVRGDKFVLLTENGVYKTKKWQENKKGQDFCIRLWSSKEGRFRNFEIFDQGFILIWTKNWISKSIANTK